MAKGPDSFPKGFNNRETQVTFREGSSGSLLWKSLWLCASLSMLFFVNESVAQQSRHGKIRFECNSCHATDSWKMRKDASFKHEATGFALTGQHKVVRCESCHKDLKFAKKFSDCLSCHTDVHKSEPGENCKRCHTTQTWKITDMVQKHQSTRFPLLGKHTTLACQTCHSNAVQQQYRGTSTDCFACHRNEFSRTLKPNHATSGFSTNCVLCHQVTSSSWNGWFAHEKKQLAVPTQCVSCHKVDFTSATNPVHTSARFSTECQSCHHSTRTWAGANFDHSQTLFPLIGAHQAQQCARCHSDNVFAGKSTDCVSCHRSNFNATANPKHVASNFPIQCQTCHTQTTWRPATFNHSNTRFPLTGGHVAVACAQCHLNNQYTNTPMTCVGCHQTTFNNTTNPNHRTGGFSTNCTTCHTNASWRPATFDHATTRFALTGRHTTTQCVQCHTNGNYQLAFTDCFPCHETQYNQPTSPRHVLAGFAHNCLPCHNTTIWRPSTFSHASTAFPLVGAHQAVTCNQCHVNNQYQLPHTCFDCHATRFNNTTNPNHQQGQFSHDCLQCHAQSAWQPATFSHATTNFPLTGRHSTLQCVQCHTNSNYQLVYTNCFPCHDAQYNQPAIPRHVLPSFAHNCLPCHSTTIWRPSTFSHASTGFPLVGAHQTVTCNQCHVNNQYTNTPMTCIGCHQTTFNNTTNPNHRTGGFSTNCTTCHTTASWRPATFDHATTRFALTGRHTTTQCVQCHTNGNYQLVYTNCFPCHETQYNQPASPRHVLPSFAHNCLPCHSTTIWRPSTFSHARTAFPLAGAHQTVTCNQCHVNNQYQLPHTCFDCHSTRFNNTTNPNHQQGQFSHDCLQCHSQSAWQPATFNHATTNFPLTGAHITTQCVQCHVNGNYQLQYTNCYPCHTTQFAQPTNPNHVLGNFNHDCAPCHTTTVWHPSTFNHASTAFQLVGAHQAVACNLCHSNNQYQNLPHTCFDCHATTFNNTTNPNHQQGQFSHDCLQCHSQSAWQPATFNHATTNFPLTGAHITTQCVQCHTNGNYQLVYTNCYPCHTTQFAQPTNPNHVLGNFNHDCAPCHTTTVWRPSTFNHANTAFQLVGAHQAVACNLCHVNNQYQLPHTCFDCHATTFNNTTNPNHQQGQFSHDCLQCHSQSAWQPATFNHATTDFPLTGRHITTPCVQCHVGGNYQLQYADCYQCHAPDFARPTNPNHVTQLFSRNCTICHSTTVWTPNTMNHDAAYFRIYSGAHRNRWTQCSQCHTSLGNLAAWSCTTGCHSRAETDGHHIGRPDYVYDSAACYSCHRNE